MGGFVFQEVINVGIQILGLIGLGWTFSHIGLLDQKLFLPQVNLLILQVRMSCEEPRPFTAVIYLLAMGASVHATLDPGYNKASSTFLSMAAHDCHHTAVHTRVGYD